MARRERERRGGSSLIGQIIALVVLIPLAIFAVSWVLSPSSPFNTPKPTQNDQFPVVIRAIRSANQLVTAQTEVDAPVTGTSKSMLPGSEEKIIYYAVYNVVAGIDMSKIKDSDVTVNSDGTVQIVLPPPTIISQALDTSKSYVLTHDIGPTAAIGGADQTLMDQVLKTAHDKANTALLKDGSLLDAAKRNAETDLTDLLTKAGVKGVTFVDTPTTPTVVPNITPVVTP